MVTKKLSRKGKQSAGEKKPKQKNKKIDTKKINNVNRNKKEKIKTKNEIKENKNTISKKLIQNTPVKKNNLKKTKTENQELKEKQLKNKMEENRLENNAREAIRVAQQSTLDIIKAAAQRIEREKAMKNQNVDGDYMEVLTPRKRGRPPKSGKRNKHEAYIYEPEFDGLMEDNLSDKADNTPSSFMNENETIDFWTDDDIPIAHGWKEDVIEF